MMMDGVVVKIVNSRSLEPSKGSAGQRTQIPGAMASVSNLASATGGIGPDNLAESDTK